MSESSEPYGVEWASPALRALNRLPGKVATAAVEFAYGGLAQRPALVGRPLRLDLEGLHAARRGDHRILYRIDEARRVVVIVAIAHRADAYRRR